MIVPLILAGSGSLTLTPASPPVADIYVDGSATCSAANGSAGAPYCSVGEAVAVAVPGDVIRIAPGTYPETLFLPTRLTLLGVGGRDVTIIDGTQSGRVVDIQPGTDIVIDGLTITGGRSSQGAAGISSLGDLLLVNSTVAGNTSFATNVRGGGIRHGGAGDLTIRNSMISGNTAQSFYNTGGGLLAVGGGTVTIEGSTFADNYAIFGGAMSVITPVLRVSSSTFSGNFTYYGSTAFARSIDAQFSNSTMSQNVGGGLYLQPMTNGSVGIDHCTFVGNGPLSYGYPGSRAALEVNPFSGGPVEVSSSVIAGNFDFAGPRDVMGPAVSLGSNFIGAQMAGASAFLDGVNGDHVGTTAAPIDPMLGPFGSNGGVTQTLVPLPGSPLVGAGAMEASPTPDQRGLPRVPGPSDIGAVRYSLGSLPVICDPVPNSTGQTGDLFATGAILASSNQLQLVGTSLPAQQFTLFLVSPTVGITPHPGGSDGVLCLASPVGRFLGPGQLSSTGASGSVAIPIDLSRIPQGTGTVATVAGTSWTFQAWHRDLSGGVATSNLTSAVSVVFQ